MPARVDSIHRGGHYVTETLGIRRLGELVGERFGIDDEFIEGLIDQAPARARFPLLAGKRLKISASTIYLVCLPQVEEKRYVADSPYAHQLAHEMNMKGREVISKCMEMGVPISNGRIDKTLFLSNLRLLGEGQKTPQTAA